MTNQEIFDEVWRQLIDKQHGRRAVSRSDGRTCMYRTEDGLRCAAGALISDEHYHGGLEGLTADNHKVAEALRLSGVPGTQVDLVCALQDAHDNTRESGQADQPAVLRRRLRAVAAEWHLDAPAEAT